MDFSNALSHHCTVAWVTRPERPKGVKEGIKQAQSNLEVGPRRAPRLLVFFNFSYALSHHCTVAWVTRPECPKGVKDVIKQMQMNSLGDADLRFGTGKNI